MSVCLYVLLLTAHATVYCMMCVLFSGLRSQKYNIDRFKVPSNEETIHACRRIVESDIVHEDGDTVHTALILQSIVVVLASSIRLFHCTLHCDHAPQ
jgi:hypothetical protein